MRQERDRPQILARWATVAILVALAIAVCLMVALRPQDERSVGQHARELARHTLEQRGAHPTESNSSSSGKPTVVLVAERILQHPDPATTAYKRDALALLKASLPVSYEDEYSAKWTLLQNALRELWSTPEGMTEVLSLMRAADAQTLASLIELMLETCHPADCSGRMGWWVDQREIPDAIHVLLDEIALGAAPDRAAVALMFHSRVRPRPRLVAFDAALRLLQRPEQVHRYFNGAANRHFNLSDLVLQSAISIVGISHQEGDEELAAWRSEGGGAAALAEIASSNSWDGSGAARAALRHLGSLDAEVAVPALCAALRSSEEKVSAALFGLSRRYRELDRDQAASEPELHEQDVAVGIMEFIRGRQEPLPPDQRIFVLELATVLRPRSNGLEILSTWKSIEVDPEVQQAVDAAAEQLRAGVDGAAILADWYKQFVPRGPPE